MRLQQTPTRTWALVYGAAIAAALGCSADIAPNDEPGPSANAGTGPGTGGLSSAGASASSGGTGANSPVGSGGSGGVGQGGAAGTQCAPFELVSRRIWRLSNLQYSNVIRDLLGITDPPEITGGGTSLLAFYSKETETVDERLEFSYYQAAEAVVAKLNPTTLAACTAGEAEQACAQRLAQKLAPKAYRRPVSTEEVSDLVGLYTEGRKTDFASGVRLMVEGILLAPSFAYRSELGKANGAEFLLTADEVASQLSFLFLDTLPDDALRAAAADGSLATDQGVAQQVDRLMALPAAQKNISRIVVDWFGGREMKNKDATLFPEYTPEVQQDMMTATRLFVEDVLWKGTRQLNDLLLSPKLFVSPASAKVLGYTVPSGTQEGQFVAVTAAAGQRAGMLTQPGIMAAKSNTDATSVVHRGKYLLKDVLCGVQIPDPPAGLLEQPEIQAVLNTLKTEEERANYRLSTSACIGCHVHIDPFGMMLEHIDPIGRYRTTLPSGAPVKASYEMSFSPALTGTIDGAQEFAQGLIEDELVSSCGARKLASYALGREQSTSCELNGVHDRFEASADQSLASLLREVVLARVMRVRAGGSQ